MVATDEGIGFMAVETTFNFMTGKYAIIFGTHKMLAKLESGAPALMSDIAIAPMVKSPGVR